MEVDGKDDLSILGVKLKVQHGPIKTRSDDKIDKRVEPVS